MTKQKQLFELTLYESVRRSAERFPGRTALVYQGKRIAYRTFLSRIDSLAAGLYAHGIREREVVTICMPNIPESVYALYAVNKLGAVAHMVHPLAPPARLAEYVAETGSKLVFLPEMFYAKYRETLRRLNLPAVVCGPADSLGTLKRGAYRLLHRADRVRAGDSLAIPSKRMFEKRRKRALPAGAACAAPDPRADAVYLHSGGTGAKPKTIRLSSYAIQSLAANTEYILKRKDFENFGMFAVLPLFHGFGLCMGVHCMLAHGGFDALVPKFSAEETVKLLKKGRLQCLIGVPSLYEALLTRSAFSGKTLEKLEIAFVGGDFVSQELLERFNARMRESGCPAALYEGYGLTEVVTVCAVNLPGDSRAGTVGRALPGIEIRIADAAGNPLPSGTPGEILVAGEERMSGYLGDEAETSRAFFRADGKIFVKTGDFGSLDESGYLTFLSRIKRIVKVSGVSVYPSEIEQLAVRFPGVAGAYAAGIPDKKRGFAVALFLQSEGEPDERGIAAAIRENLSVYARPVRILTLKEFPRTAVGKTDPAALIQLLEREE